MLARTSRVPGTNWVWLARPHRPAVGGAGAAVAGPVDRVDDEAVRARGELGVGLRRGAVLTRLGVEAAAEVDPGLARAELEGGRVVGLLAGAESICTSGGLRSTFHRQRTAGEWLPSASRAKTRNR